MAQARNLTVALKLIADGKGMVGEVRLGKREIESLGKSADAAGDRAKTAGRQIRLFGSDSNLAAGRMRQLSGAASATVSQLSGLSAILATIGAVTFARDLLGAISSAQQLNSRLRALTGSSEEYAQAQAFVSQASERLSIDLNTARGNYASLLALQKAGLVTTNDARLLFEGLANAATQLGASNAQLEQTMFGLAQGLSAGTLRAEEFNQVVEPLPGLMQALDKAAGLGAGGFRQLVNEGKVTADFFKTTLIRALQEYEGAAESMAGNLSQQYTRLKNAYQQFKEAMEAPVSAAVTPVLEFLTEAARAMPDVWRLAQLGVIEFVGRVDAGFADVRLATSIATEYIKQAWTQAIDVLRLGWSGFLEIIAAGLDAIPGAADATRSLRATASELYDQVQANRIAYEDFSSAQARLVADRNQEIRIINGTVAALKQDIIARLTLGKTVEEVRGELGNLNDAVIAGTSDTKKAAEAAKAHNKAVAEAKRIFDQTRTPLERYNDELERLKELHAGGLIDADTLSRAMRQAADEYNRAARSAEDFGSQAETVSREWVRAAREINDAIADWVVGGFRDGSDIIRGLMQRLLGDLVRMALNNPIQIITTLTGGAGGLVSTAASASGLGGAGGAGQIGQLGSSLVDLSTITDSVVSSLSGLGNAISPYTAPAGTTLSGSASAGIGGGALGGVAGGIYGYQRGGVRGAAIGTGVGVAAGGAIGGALAGAGGGLAGIGAGALTGASAALAAIPVWGWAALAGLAIFGSGRKKPHPWAVGVAGPEGSRDFAGRNFQAGASGLSIGRDVKHLDEQDAVNFQTALLGIDQALVQLTGGLDRFGNEIDLSMTSMGSFGVTAHGFIAGLEDGKDRFVETGEEITAWFVKDWVVAAKAFDEQSTSIILGFKGAGEAIVAGIEGLVAIQQFLDADLLENFGRALAQSQMTLFDTFQAQRQGVLDLAAAYDGSVESTRNLAGATQSLFALQINLLTQIEQASRGIARGFEEARESLIRSNLSDEDKFNRLFSQANAELEKVRTGQDPAAVEAAGQKALSLATQAINTLGDSQRQAMEERLLKWLTDAEELTTSRLGTIKTALVEDSGEVKGAIRTAMDEAAQEIRTAAQDIKAAAQDIKAAAQTPSRVEVTNRQIIEERQTGFAGGR